MNTNASWLSRLRARVLAEQWRIGFVDAPIGSLLQTRVTPKVSWMTPPDSLGWWADPFAHPTDPTLVYAERFDESLERGWIECMAVEGDRLVSRGEVLAVGADGVPSPLGKGLHVSFPYAFQCEDGGAYALAETGASRELRLYSLQTPTRWRDEGPLMENVSAADPAIFRRDGRYWLVYTDADRDLYDHLMLFHAEDLRGPWTPHPANPIVRGRAGSRMGGSFFVHSGMLYRPGQDCVKGYGMAVMVHRVDLCTPDEYRETLVARIEPDPEGSAPHGLHTINPWGARTLVDGKRWIVNPRVWRRKASRRLGLSLA